MAQKARPWIDTLPPYYRRDSATFCTVDRAACAATFAMTSQTLYLALGIAYVGTITNLTMGFATAATNPANWWFALYDSSLNLLSQTADQTTTAIGANSNFTLALGTPQQFIKPTQLYAGVMVKATGMPNLVRATTIQAAASYTPSLCGSSTTGLTTTAPNPAAAITFAANQFWCIGT